MARAERLASHAAMASVAANGFVDERDSHRLAHHPFVPGSSAASFRFKHEAAFPRKPHEQHKFLEETKSVHELLICVCYPCRGCFIPAAFVGCVAYFAASWK